MTFHRRETAFFYDNEGATRGNRRLTPPAQVATPPTTLGKVFDSLSDRLSAVFGALKSKGRLTEADIDATAREIRIALLEADVALPVVKAFISALKERARGAEVHKALNPAQQVIKIVHEEMINVLGGETRRIQFAKKPPTVIMLAGLQGSGKTTLAGKLGHWLRQQGHTPLLVAADLQRPNAVQQLSVVAQRAEVEVFAPEPGNGVGDPVDVARRAMEHSQQKQHDVVIVDTAGRLGIDTELMAQAAAIRDAVQPDETLFVVDAMIGQDAVTTAEAFRDGVGFSGVVLSKLDGDARGGAALSVRYVTGQPIMFASTGEKLTDFDVFHPDRMASRILGMGDVLTLIEQAQTAFDADQQERMAKKMLGGQGELTLDDFLEQMLAVRKLGIGNLMRMMPGMAQAREQIDQLDDKHMDRITAIIRSMTPAERGDPKIINASRRGRIAGGSGTTVTDVNQLVDRFFEARKTMKQMGGKLGLPGIGGGIGRGRKNTKSKNKRKGKGGKKTGKFGGANSPFGLPSGENFGTTEDKPDSFSPGFDMPKLDFSQLPKSDN